MWCGDSGQQLVLWIPLTLIIAGCENVSLPPVRPPTLNVESPSSGDRSNPVSSSTGAVSDSAATASTTLDPVPGSATAAVNSRDLIPTPGNPDGASTTEMASGTPPAAGVSIPTDVGSSASSASTDPNASVDQTAAVSANAAVNAVDSTAVSRPEPGIRLLVTERKFSVEGPEQAVRVSFDDLDLLKVLNLEPVPLDAVGHFPDWLKQLNGRRIRIRGFMYPVFQETGLDQFVLARDNQICCFGRDPKVYDLVAISMRKGKTTNYIPYTRSFDVHGVFRIEPLVDGDKLLGLYSIEDALVIDR